jgi:hypothetical protein
MIKAITEKLAEKPKLIFLVDGLGALLTACLLFLIPSSNNYYFGLPPNTPTFLSLAALALCIYSLSCYLFLNKNRPFFLRTIIVANLVYCCLTAFLAIRHYQTITALGLTYFIAEIVVICMLIYVEWSLLKKVSTPE